MHLKNVFLSIFVAVVFISASSSANANIINRDRAGDDPNSVEIWALTYNVCGLPDLITAERGLAPAEKRLPYIGWKIHEKYDIVGLQEMFIPERAGLEARMKAFFVVHGTDSQDPRVPGSGIYNFSRWPIKKALYEKWEKLISYDELSHKGFVGMKTYIREDLIVDVYNLHAQAGDAEMRKDNYRQLLEGMKSMSIGTGRPIIVMGDFNCSVGEEECDWIIKNGGFTHTQNPIDKDRIDHIFYIRNGSEWNIESLETADVFTEKVQDQRVSDHFGFESHIRFFK